MILYGLVALWGLALFASFAGWGGLLGRVLFPGQPVGPGERTCWGLALVTVVGGFLNLAGVISPALMIAIVLVGLLGATLDLKRRRPAVGEVGPPDVRRRWPWAAVGLIGLGLVGRYLEATDQPQLNAHDDLLCYLSFPIRMLQSGSLGRDPFCVRRVMSGLGGFSFLTAFTSAVFPARSSYVLDLGVGLLALAALLIEIGTRDHLSPPARLSAVAMVLSYHLSTYNLGPLLISIALLLAIWASLARPGPVGGRVVVVALLASCLCSLKSTMIPPAFFLLAIYSILAFIRGDGWRGRLGVAATSAVMASLTLAFLIPWMISLKQSSGTYLYPILGLGTEASGYDPDYPKFVGDFSGLADYARHLIRGLTEPISFAAFASAFAVLGSAAWSRRWRPEDIALVCMPLPTLFYILLNIDVDTTIRYAYPSLMAGIVGGVMILLRPGRSDPSRPGSTVPLVLGVLVLGIFVGANSNGLRSELNLALSKAKAALSGRVVTDPEDRDGYRRAQEVIPPAAPILARVTRPDLFRFDRNPIYVADWPGGASPAPGMPTYRGPEPVAAYLLDRGIRYVIFSYGDSCLLPPPIADDSAQHVEMASFWCQTVFRYGHDFQDSLSRLMKTRHRLLDDGMLAVIDLATPATAGPPRGEVGGVP